MTEKTEATSMDRSDTTPLWPITGVYLLHGKGGSPNGTVKKIQAVLENHWPGLDFVRPELPHHDPMTPAEESVEFLLKSQIPNGTLLMGISLGGLVAAKLQEAGREDLQVIAISSPTSADGVRLENAAERRLAFYSSRDHVIESRVAEWPELASFSRNFDWLTHDTDQHLRYVSRFFDWYLQGMLAKRIDEVRSPSLTQQEVDEIVWNSMATRQLWRKQPAMDFADLGNAIQSGKDWESAFDGWNHQFVNLKDPRCLAQEPPIWISPERRALLGGVAEFYSNLYKLPKPGWIEKPEYFLREPEYLSYLTIKIDEKEVVMWLPESDADLFRLRAKTPKEMLRRNVIYAARNLTLV